jgi:predicted ester cyclase
MRRATTSRSSGYAGTTNTTPDIQEIHFLRIAGNQIVEHWNNFDQLGILRQLGAIPG